MARANENALLSKISFNFSLFAHIFERFIFSYVHSPNRFQLLRYVSNVFVSPHLTSYHYPGPSSSGAHLGVTDLKFTDLDVTGKERLW